MWIFLGAQDWGGEEEQDDNVWLLHGGQCQLLDPPPHALPLKTPASVDRGSIWLLSGDPTPRNEWLSKELMWHLIFKCISFSPIQNQPRMSALRTKLVLSACTSKSCYVVLKNQFSFEVKLFWNFYYYLRNCYLSLKYW